MWLVHTAPWSGEIAAVLERGALDYEAVADDFIEHDINAKGFRNNDGFLKTIEDGSIDLITIHQGLHHMPIENLFGFLSEVSRVLAPGGLFIFREHDADVGSITVPSAPPPASNGSSLPSPRPQYQSH